MKQKVGCLPVVTSWYRNYYRLCLTRNSRLSPLWNIHTTLVRITGKIKKRWKVEVTWKIMLNTKIIFQRAYRSICRLNSGYLHGEFGFRCSGEKAGLSRPAPSLTILIDTCRCESRVFDDSLLPEKGIINFSQSPRTLEVRLKFLVAKIFW